jgi:flagellar hook-associated protein 1
MSDLLAIGTSGIKAYSRALSTVGDNIANAQTPGFARRTTRLSEIAAAGDVVLNRNQVHPGGVTVSGIDRSVDSFLIDDARISDSDAGRSSAKLGWVEATERALDDGASGVGQSVTAVFNAADKLATDPANTALRAGFLNSVRQAADAFRQTAADLNSVGAGISADAGSVVTNVNTDLATLGRVNAGLLRARDGSTNQATLFDERDRLVDAISSNLGVTATFGTHGTATLTSSDTSGAVLIDGPTVNQLSLVTASDGQLSLSISGGSALISSSGRLAGLVEAATHVSAQVTALDTLSNQFATRLNAAHQAGQDAGGNPGLALLDAGGGAVAIAALTLDPSQVAAADGTTANGNILSLSGLRGSGGVEQSWAALVAQQSQSVATARAQDAAATTRRDGAASARDNISAVDLDQEAADLLRYQQAYEGAARTIRVASEIFQSILQIT